MEPLNIIKSIADAIGIDGDGLHDIQIKKLCGIIDKFTPDNPHAFMSPKIGAISAALSKAQVAFKFEEIVKTKEVSFKTTSYKYVPYENMVNACKDALKENELSIAFLVTTRDTMIGVLSHSSGEYLISEKNMDLNAEFSDKGKGKFQAEGSAMTYTQKYLYKALLNLPQGDDDGVSASKNTVQQDIDEYNKEHSKPKEAVKPSKDYGRVVKVCKEYGVDKSGLIDYINQHETNVSDMTKEIADKIIEDIKKAKGEKNEKK